jgi:agmatine deiminase
MESPTPRALNYMMPAEWTKHDATWLSWPKNPLTFPEDIIDSIEEVYCQMISALSGGELVKIIIDGPEDEDRIRQRIERGGANMRNVELPHIRSSDVWIRDYGPSFLLNLRTGEKAAVKWRFNAWGEKYDELLYDDVAGENVVRASGVRTFRPGIVLEGGSIDVNGAGMVLTTEQCLLNKNRNPQLDREDIERYLAEYIDTPEVLWLKSGIEGDDTDGHVDDFARFVSERKVVCAYDREGAGHNPTVLKTNLDILKGYRNMKGEKLEVIELPLPRPLYLEEEERYLPASYANFYIGNRVVLVPVFDDPSDAAALDVLGACFPERTIVPILARDLVYGYGGIHCITQQEPSRSQGNRAT